MQLRRATMDDALDVLEWRNDPHTIEMCRLPMAVPEENHLAWFERTLASGKARIFIASEGGRKLGMVRFDEGNPGVWEISINMAPGERNKGYGYRALKKAIMRLGDSVEHATITADIKGTNVRSLRIFEKAGFTVTRRDRDFVQMAHT